MSTQANAVLLERLSRQRGLGEKTEAPAVTMGFCGREHGSVLRGKRSGIKVQKVLLRAGADFAGPSSLNLLAERQPTHQANRERADRKDDVDKEIAVAKRGEIHHPEHAEQQVGSEQE